MTRVSRKPRMERWPRCADSPLQQVRSNGAPAPRRGFCIWARSARGRSRLHGRPLPPCAPQLLDHDMIMPRPADAPATGSVRPGSKIAGHGARGCPSAGYGSTPRRASGAPTGHTGAHNGPAVLGLGRAVVPYRDARERRPAAGIAALPRRTDARVIERRHLLIVVSPEAVFAQHPWLDQLERRSLFRRLCDARAVSAVPGDGSADETGAAVFQPARAGTPAVAAATLFALTIFAPPRFGEGVLYVAMASLFLFALVASINAWYLSAGRRRTVPRTFAFAFGFRDICWTFVYAAAAPIWFIGLPDRKCPEPLSGDLHSLVYICGTLVAVPLIAYGILRTQLFDIDLRIRWTISRRRSRQPSSPSCSSYPRAQARSCRLSWGTWPACSRRLSSCSSLRRCSDSPNALLRPPCPTRRTRRSTRHSARCRSMRQR